MQTTQARRPTSGARYKLASLVQVLAVGMLVAPYVSHPSPLSDRVVHAALALVSRGLFWVWAFLAYYYAPSKVLAGLQLLVSLCVTGMGAHLDGRVIPKALGLPEVPVFLLLYSTIVAVVLFPVLGLRRAEKLARLMEGCCRTCGYDLRGNASGRCPECGTEVPAADK
ncbi:MAG: hypothetical protein KKB50_03780 [Planctomycetes bacterium]|nr:hypothetical protein [Planctomycetota bacterium]